MRFALTLGVAMALALTSTASAAIVSTSRVDDSDSGPPGDWTYTVHVEDTSRDRNKLRIESRRGAVIVRDRVRLRDRSGYCRALGRRAVRCAVGDVIQVRLASGDDQLTVATRNDPDRDPIPDVDVVGGTGDDRVLLEYGGSAAGGSGNDVLRARGRPFARTAYLSGGLGRDRIQGGRRADLLDGGRGNDVVEGMGGRDRVSGGTGRDALYGGSGADRLNDDDVDLRGARPRRSVGADRLVGGTGADTVESYVSRSRPVFVDLNRRGGDGQLRENDSLSRVEHIWGGAGDDRLIGDGDGNHLIGGAGDDFLRGRGGDDRLDVLDGDRARGDLGDDEIRTVSWARAAFSCGDGDDRVTLEPRLVNARREPSTPFAGLLVPADCERMFGRHTDEQGFVRRLELDPVPSGMTSDGDLTFQLFEHATSDYALTLTRPGPPYEDADSTPLGQDEVTVTAPRDIADEAAAGPAELRARALADALVWRFRVRR